MKEEHDKVLLEVCLRKNTFKKPRMTLDEAQSRIARSLDRISNANNSFVGLGNSQSNIIDAPKAIEVSHYSVFISSYATPQEEPDSVFISSQATPQEHHDSAYISSYIEQNESQEQQYSPYIPSYEELPSV